MIQVPNHTQIPNEFIDKCMGELTHAQFKVLIAICRKTIGWHKHSDYISISQIVELANVSNKTVVSALRQLEEMGYITTKKSKRTTTLITINYQDSASVTSTSPSVMSTQGSVTSTPVASVMSTHTKETLKETIYKDSKSSIPTLDEVIAYFDENGYTKEHATKMYQFYSASVTSNKQKYWKDSKGNYVRNWKQKCISVWFKDEGKKGAGSGAEDAWAAQGFSPVGIL